MVSSILTRLRHFYHEGRGMPNATKEALICFESVPRAIMAEQLLVENGIATRVMPTPAAIRGGCGFCLRFAPGDLERAARFLSGRGLSTADAYLRVETDGAVSYEKTVAT